MSTDIRTIARGDASRIVEGRRSVARTDEQWRAMWLAHAGPGPEAPPVDFASRMVAAVFQGQRPSAGFDTSIVGTTLEAGVLAVQVVEHLPLAPRVAANVLVSPFHIVSLPRVEGDVRFVDAMPHANADTQAAPAPAAAPLPIDLTSVPQAPRVRADAVPPPRRAPVTSGGSSTGLSPEAAGALAYLAGPFSGALLLIVERTNRSVRFHAWQAFVGLGGLGLAALTFLGLAFVFLLFSPRGFAIMRWAAAGTAVMGVVVWAWCLWRAYKGQEWMMPLVGPRAQRWAAR
ncbi:MAG: hypothetical protein ABI211_19850 [Vicinamibacterales bacterium]